MKGSIVTLLFLTSLISFGQETSKPERFKIAVIGLTHTHVHILGRPDRGDIEIVGIVEPNRELAQRYADQHGYSMDLVFNNTDELLEDVKPDGVCAFGNIYDHLEVVETFAPLGIHVMVEKPLAISSKHASKMAALAKEFNIHLLTNYETTWYPTLHEAKRLYDNAEIGDLRKVIVRDGHRGPVKIGINSEFLDWLIDPELNGGGAITDFGCYGANIMTWLSNGEKPKSVTAITQTLQPDNHPEVDDEATILLEYEDFQAIIQASWNWPIGRKDMELHGLNGTIFQDNRHDLRVRIAEGYDGFKEMKVKLEEREIPYNDPFVYFSEVVNGNLKPSEFALSSLKNNLIVMEILDTARKSADKGKTINLD